MTHLASHGFVVVAPDHTGNTVWDGLAGRLNFETSLAAFPQRLGDMPFVGDAIVETTGPLAGLADPERWAVMGHSFGGSIALALTEPRRGIEPDPRFRVAIPMTPGTGALPILGFDILRSRVPVLFFAAQLDETISWESDQLPGYERAPERGENFEFGPAELGVGEVTRVAHCRKDLRAAEEDISDLLEDGCGPDFIDPAEMLDLQRWLATSFLNGYLRDSPPAFSRLSPAALPPNVAAALEYRVEGVPTAEAL